MSADGSSSDTVCYPTAVDYSYAPCSSQALSNLKVVVDSMRFYHINANATQSQAIAIGSYPEDVYYEGKPWYLTTCAVAEQLYHALNAWDAEEEINIDQVSLHFFRDLVADVETERYGKFSLDGMFAVLVSKVREYSDGVLKVVQEFTPEEGAIAEQFGKEDGRPISARHLTWSYVAVLGANTARDGHVPPGWDGALEWYPTIDSLRDQ